MVRKNERDDPLLPARDGSVAGIGKVEVDDEDTAPVLEKIADAATDDRADENLTDDSGEAPDGSAPFELTGDDTLAPGFLLRDRYRIVSLVHSGGMGHVYKAFDIRRQRNGSDQIHVAIKMIRRSVAPQIDAHLALAHEAAKMQRLSHPNIVNIFDFDRHDEQFFLVMEWLEGESVNALLRRTSGRRLAAEFAWRVIKGIGSGLQHAHSNNVVHADIHPSNIFITDTQEIKLLDFGVARYGSDRDDATNDRIAWAMRRYASPEVLSGSTPTFQDDIFSLGCVAYRLLTGTHPFGDLPSIDAKQADVTVERVPGLSETHWQTLSRALSYARSDRPNTASVFLADRPTATSSEFMGRVRDWLPIHWLRVLPVATIALLAGVWWLSQIGSQNEPPGISESMSVDDKSSVDAEATFEPSELDELLSSAAQAIDEERFITPVDSNARGLYRDVLVLDSANSIALNGLRTISDVYVQEANSALRTGAPTQTIAALAIAAETDPNNPAIAVVTELLLAQGNAQLANARLAAAEGDTARAAELLSIAEQYTLVDVNAINAVRRQIAQSTEDGQFLERLAAADAHGAAGRLTSPAGDNAQELLIELHRDHDTDPRLLESMERQGERLLTRAVFASTTDQFPEAIELLDAADALGVLPAEVAAARTLLERAMEETTDAKIVEAESAAASAAAGSAAQSALSGGESKNASPAKYATAEQTSMPAPSSNVSDPAAAAIADSGTIATDESSEPRLVPLSDLAIEKYVAPRFPRLARRRGQTGVVDLKFSVYTDGSTGAIEIVHAEPSEIFDSSAENAVKQWRFAPRDDVISAQVTMRFEQPP